LIILLFDILTESEKELIDKIFDESNIKLYNISLNMLHSPADAEDAVAKTFLKIMDHIEKIKRLPDCKIAPYCVVIIKNISTDILRERKKIVSFNELENMDWGGEDSFEEFLKNLDQKQLMSVIDRLSKEEQYFLQLRYAHEMSFKEIAELSGVQEEAAKKRVQRILKKLRAFYEEGEKIVQSI